MIQIKYENILLFSIFLLSLMYRLPEKCNMYKIYSISDNYGGGWVYLYSFIYLNAEVVK